MTPAAAGAAVPDRERRAPRPVSNARRRQGEPTAAPLSAMPVPAERADKHRAGQWPAVTAAVTAAGRRA